MLLELNKVLKSRAVPPIMYEPLSKAIVGLVQEAALSSYVSTYRVCVIYAFAGNSILYPLKATVGLNVTEDSFAELLLDPVPIPLDFVDVYVLTWLPFASINLTVYEFVPLFVPALT